MGCAADCNFACNAGSRQSRTRVDLPEPLGPCTAEANLDSDVLFTVSAVRHGRCVDGRASFESPQFFQSVGIVCNKLTFSVASENQATSGGQQATQLGVLGVGFLHDFAAGNFDGRDTAADTAAVGVIKC